MAKRLAELGALQDAVTNDEAAPSRLGLAGYIRGLFIDWSANPYNPLSRLTARGRLLGYFWDSGAIGLSMNFADQNFLVKDGTVKSKSFSDIVNFTRTTNATVTNSAGVITYAPHNLLTYSEQFDNAAWVKTGTTVTANAITAPNGTNTADKIMEIAAASLPRIANGTTVSLVPYTITVYAKAAERTQIRIVADGSAGKSAYFDVSTGVIVSVGGTASATITLDNDGWYKCSLTYTPAATGNGFYIATAEAGSTIASGDATKGIYLWGAQLEIGSTATTYNSTTVKNLLGFSELFDNAAWTKSNSFVQTNLLTYSEAFDNAAWTKLRTTVTANSVLAPNGYQTADSILQAAGQTTVGQVSQTVNAVVSPYVLSVYVKPAGKNYIILSENIGTGSARNTWFNISTGTVGTTNAGHTATITPAENGYYRCSIALSVNLIRSGQVLVYVADADNSTTVVDDTLGIYAWGAQLVQGSVAGDYRRTDAAALPVYYPNHNGVVCAEKLVENTATSALHYVEQAKGAATSPYTFSVYLKAGERTWASLRSVNSASQNVRAWYNLATGIVGTVQSGAMASMESVGNGWYRCQFTLTSANASAFEWRIEIAPSDAVSGYTGDGTSGIYIFGAQLSDSASLDPYVLNAAAAPTAAAYYGARFDYDPVTLAPKGLLIEEQRANLLLNSAIAGTNLATQSVTVTAVAHTLSFYGTGTVTITGTYIGSLVGSGAYPTRSTLTFTPTAGVILLTVTGDVQFAQLEIGAFATSFIPTVASQVTRAADIASIVGSNFYGFYNQNEGSVYVQAINASASASMQALAFSDNTGNNTMRIKNTANNFTVVANGNGEVTLSVSSIASYKASAAYKINDFAFAQNNSTVVNDTAGIVPIINRLYIGVRGDGGSSEFANGTIKSISYFPQRLSNDVLKGLTA